MNLYELDALIKCIPADDQQMIGFYKRKRVQLVNEINKALKAKGLPALVMQKEELKQ